MTAAVPLAGPLVSALSERGQTVAVAESLTGGMVCSALVEVPGASVVVRGGVIAYATELKHRLLGVQADLLAANGPVDPEVAAQMALGVRARLGADWGLATTGVAGPDPQDGKAPGTVYIAVAGPLLSASIAIPTRASASEASGPRAGSDGDDDQEQAPGDETAASDPIGTRVFRLDLPGGRLAVREATTERILDALLGALGEIESTGETAEQGDLEPR